MNFEKIRHKLKAYSIIEVIVALVILLFIFFIAIEFLAHLTRSGFDIQKMRAANTLEEYIYTTRSKKQFSTAKEDFNGWTVSRELQPYAGYDSLAAITYTIYKKDSSQSVLLTKTLLENTHPSYEQNP